MGDMLVSMGGGTQQGHTVASPMFAARNMRLGRLGRILHDIDQSGFNDPFAGAKGFDIETPVAAARCDTGKVIARPVSVHHRFRNRLSVKVADDPALRLKICKDEVFCWKTSANFWGQF